MLHSTVNLKDGKITDNVFNAFLLRIFNAEKNTIEENPPNAIFPVMYLLCVNSKDTNSIDFEDYYLNYQDIKDYLEGDIKDKKRSFIDLGVSIAEKNLLAVAAYFVFESVFQCYDKDNVLLPNQKERAFVVCGMTPDDRMNNILYITSRDEQGNVVFDNEAKPWYDPYKEHCREHKVIYSDLLTSFWEGYGCKIIKNNSSLQEEC